MEVPPSHNTVGAELYVNGRKGGIDILIYIKSTGGVSESWSLVDSFSLGDIDSWEGLTVVCVPSS